MNRSFTENIGSGSAFSHYEMGQISKNKKIKLYLDFDWKTFKSKIVAEGLDDGYKIYADIPDIPIAGGCASELGYGRMVTGQMFVSSILDIAYFSLDFFLNKMFVPKDGEKIEVIKIDRCMYAPFLYTWNEKGEEVYSPILKEKYPEALEVLKELKPEENYWKKYHDNH